ncbi:phytanoyl-CoA dioxygenase family protein [Pararhodobacter zhoushanensis]|uniref:Phytanoyl-CoA dioxygenase family protein n=1 Tax=Pararhodobacter zhoushanensis TaxID=2479545 RepID=A0ABT3H3Y1_9RHOB|nr:phytanoyl-CoA dioxygenase family protein [Pararhodobacter zhoushanensis]MCW1934507.1 phytanoyl-CoA dioxygenase family protein [Pararhodobacter zhoushanensis]
MTDAHPMPHALSAEAVAQFARDGVVAPINALPPADARQLLADFERIEETRHGRLSGLVRIKPHLLLPFLWDVVHDPRIVDAVASVLGPDILCIGCSSIDKPAASDGYVAWHQDATFWGLSATDGATAWLALTPSTPASGCMAVVPGTHTRQLSHFDTQDPQNMLGAREEVAVTVDPAQARPLILNPGQMSLHHPLVLHGSGRNTTAQRRLGFVIRYVAASVRQEGATATLVRGRNLSGMALERAPEGEMHPDALARHSDIVRRAGRVIKNGKLAHLAASSAKPVDQP